MKYTEGSLPPLSRTQCASPIFIEYLLSRELCGQITRRQVQPTHSPHSRIDDSISIDVHIRTWRVFCGWSVMAACLLVACVRGDGRSLSGSDGRGLFG